MITQVGLVLRFEGTQAQVAVDKRSVSCGHCAERDACSAKESIGQRIVTANAPFEVEPGQYVRLALGSGASLGAAAAIFIMPIVVLFVGAVVGSWLGAAYGGERARALWATVLAAVAVAIYFIILRLADPWLQRLKGLRPTIIAVVERPSAEGCDLMEHRSPGR